MGILRSKKAGNEPTSRNVYALRGVALLGVFGLLLFVLQLSMSGTFSSVTPVKAQLNTAGGSIGPGSDVKMRGLVVGTITSISGDARQVDLAIDLDDQMVGQIPAGVKARVLPASVFGTSYLELTTPKGTGGPASGTVKAGEVISQDLSEPTLELQQALDSVDKLVSALGPAQLATTLNAVSTTLDGQGQQIGATLDRADSLLARVQPLVPLGRTDLRLLATNLDTVSRIAPDLFNAVDDTLVFTDHLVQQRDQLTALVAGGLNLVRDTNGVLTKNETKFVRSVRGAAGVVDALYDQRAGIRTGLLAINNLTGRLPSVTSGGMVRVTGPIVGHYAYYTRADCPRYQGHPGKNCGGR